MISAAPLVADNFQKISEVPEAAAGGLAHDEAAPEANVNAVDGDEGEEQLGDPRTTHEGRYIPTYDSAGDDGVKTLENVTR